MKRILILLSFMSSMVFASSSDDYSDDDFNVDIPAKEYSDLVSNNFDLNKINKNTKFFRSKDGQRILENLKYQSFPNQVKPVDRSSQIRPNNSIFLNDDSSDDENYFGGRLIDSDDDDDYVFMPDDQFSELERNNFDLSKINTNTKFFKSERGQKLLCYPKSKPSTEPDVWNEGLGAIGQDMFMEYDEYVDFFDMYRVHGFAAGTKISVFVNDRVVKKNIEDVKIGDIIGSCTKNMCYVRGRVLDTVSEHAMAFRARFYNMEEDYFKTVTVASGQKFLNYNPESQSYEYVGLFDIESGHQLFAMYDETRQSISNFLYLGKSKAQKTMLYSFEVDTYHNFIADGMVCHNVSPKGLAKKMAEASNVHIGEHQCQSGKSIGHTCKVYSVTFDKQHGHFNNKRQDCCPNTYYGGISTSYKPIYTKTSSNFFHYLTERAKELLDNIEINYPGKVRSNAKPVADREYIEMNLPSLLKDDNHFNATDFLAEKENLFRIMKSSDYHTCSIQ